MQKLAGSSGPVSSPVAVEFVAELQAGLVAVVAVGDEDGLGAHQALQGGDRGRVVDLPEPVDDAEVVGRLLRGPVADAGLGRLDDLVVVVGVEAEDRAEVVLGRVEEGQAVGLGAGEGLLVGVDLPLAERLEPDPGQEPLAGVGLALDLEGLAGRGNRPGGGPRGGRRSGAIP